MMKYRKHHASKDVALALGLDKKQKERVLNAVQKGFDEVAPAADGSVSTDEIIDIVAPYLHTTEEGFFAAITMLAEIQAAKEQYYSKHN